MTPVIRGLLDVEVVHQSVCDVRHPEYKDQPPGGRAVSPQQSDEGDERVVREEEQGARVAPSILFTLLWLRLVTGRCPVLGPLGPQERVHH